MDVSVRPNGLSEVAGGALQVLEAGEAGRESNAAFRKCGSVELRQDIIFEVVQDHEAGLAVRKTTVRVEGAWGAGNQRVDGRHRQEANHRRRGLGHADVDDAGVGERGRERGQVDDLAWLGVVPAADVPERCP